MPTVKSTLLNPPCHPRHHPQAYAAARPWKKAGMTKMKYLKMLDLIPHEGVKTMKNEAEAEVPEESIFGQSESET